VAFILYAVIMVRKSGLRWAMLIALVLAIGGAGFWLFTTEDASSVDAYNSVGYRQLLFQVSIDHILEHPIWGDLDFIKDPKFRVLLQGQGIIDITSLYLQIGLSFGLLGLAPFFGGFAMTMWGLLRRVVRLAADVSEDRAPTRRMGAILLLALVGWFLLIATTSDVALTLHLGVILIALARAITRFERFKPASVRVEKPPSLRELAYRILSPGERAGEAR
jgi:O-antigen ligase